MACGETCVPFCWTSLARQALLGACKLPGRLRPARPDRRAGGAWGGGSAAIAAAHNAARNPAVSSLSTSQRLILATAADRADGAVLPLPDGFSVRGRARRLMLNGMIKRGLISERPAPDDEPAWAEGDGDCHAGRPRSCRINRPRAILSRRSAARACQPASRCQRAGPGTGRPIQQKAGGPPGHQAGAARRPAPPARGRYHRRDPAGDRLAAAYRPGGDHWPQEEELWSNQRTAPRWDACLPPDSQEH
jgi:hypothetical protein